jgi:hypothetical protein
MMTLAELQQAKIHPQVAKEAFDQVSQRLADVLAVKSAYEQKAFVLLTGYITVAVALFSVGGALTDHALQDLKWGMWTSGAAFVVGSWCLVASLLDDNYGMLASAPDMWLRKGVIDGDDSALPAMHAYLTFYHQNRLEKSERANNLKAVRVRAGIVIGILGPIFLVARLYVWPVIRAQLAP